MGQGRGAETSHKWQVAVASGCLGDAGCGSLLMINFNDPHWPPKQQQQKQQQQRPLWTTMWHTCWLHPPEVCRNTWQTLKREWECQGGTHMTTNTLKLVINVYRYYGTRGASVSFVCLPWRKTFRQAPKKRTLPLPLHTLPRHSCPPLNLCADNEMQTNHVGETSAKCRAERRFMGAKWKYYHKQKTRDGAKRGRVWGVGGVAVSQGQLPARVINICCCCCCRGQLAAKIACLLLDFSLSPSLSPPLPVQFCSLRKVL